MTQFFFIVYVIDLIAVISFLKFDGGIKPATKVTKPTLLGGLLLIGVFSLFQPMPQTSLLMLMGLLVILSILHLFEKQDVTADLASTTKKVVGNQCILSHVRMMLKNISLFRWASMSLFLNALFIFLVKKGDLVFGSLGLEAIWDVLKTIDSFNVLGFFFFIWMLTFVLLSLYLFKRFLFSNGKNIFGMLKKELLNLGHTPIILISLFAVAFFIRMKSIYFNSNLPDSFIMPLVGANMATNGIFTFVLDWLPSLGINYHLPSGAVYFKGVPFMVSQALSFNLLGFTDIAARFPSIIFGSLSVVLIYLIGKRVYNREAGLAAAILLAFSGWAVYMSTYIRFYSMHTMFFLLSIFLYLKYRETRADGWFFSLCVILSVWNFVNPQVFVMFVVLLFLMFLDIILLNEKAKNKLIRVFSTSLILFVPLFLVWNPLPQTRTGFIQFAAYHFGFESWVFVLSLVLLGSVYTIKKWRGLRVNILFYLPFLALPYLIFVENINRDYLIPQYTTAFFPLFLLFFSIPIAWLAVSACKRLTKRKPNQLLRYVSVILAVIAVSMLFSNFISPLDEYTQESIRPDLYDYKTGGFYGYSVLKFRFGYDTVVGPDLTALPKNASIAMVNPFSQSLCWYAKINEETMDERLAPISFEMKGYDKWFRSYVKEDVRLAHYCDINVITTIPDLDEVIDSYEFGYILVSDFGLYRLDNEAFFGYVENEPRLTKRLDENDVHVYSWGVVAANSAPNNL